MQRSREEKIGSVVIYIFLILFAVLILVPVVYILRQSVDVGAYKNGISLWPDKFSWAYYKMVLSNSSIYGPLKNTVLITISGTLLSVAVNATAAYPLYRKDYGPRKFLVYYMVIVPMLFSGGMIPTYRCCHRADPSLLLRRRERVRRAQVAVDGHDEGKVRRDRECELSADLRIHDEHQQDDLQRLSDRSGGHL